MTSAVNVPAAQQPDGAALAKLLDTRPELAEVGIRPYLVQATASAV